MLKEGMADKKESAGGGIGITSVLGTVFIVLKLTGHISWSWLWVLSPFWIPLTVVVTILVIYAAFAIGGAILDQRRLNRRTRRNLGL
jgi:hypothetical protein